MDPETFPANVVDLFDTITRGHVKVDTGLHAKFAYIARVHQMAERRKTNGAILITP